MTLDEFKAELELADYSVSEMEGITVLMDTGWEIEFKDYAHRSVVVKAGENFYEVTTNRSGSYYTDYHYGDTEVTQVKPKEVTTTIYVPI